MARRRRSWRTTAAAFVMSSIRSTKKARAVGAG
jgi:hypothetical protein